MIFEFSLNKISEAHRDDVLNHIHQELFDKLWNLLVSLTFEKSMVIPDVFRIFADEAKTEGMNKKVVSDIQLRFVNFSEWRLLLSEIIADQDGLPFISSSQLPFWMFLNISLLSIFCIFCLSLTDCILLDLQIADDFFQDLH